MLVADVDVDGSIGKTGIFGLRQGGVIGLCPLPNTPLFQLTAKAETIGTDVEGVVHRAIGHRIGRVRGSRSINPQSAW